METVNSQITICTLVQTRQKIKEAGGFNAGKNRDRRFGLQPPVVFPIRHHPSRTGSLLVIFCFKKHQVFPVQHPDSCLCC